MTIATWNVNSVRARLERLTNWLESNQPDVLCLQEVKVTDDNFPIDVIINLGYHAALHGQKTYNGVALLSRSEITDVRRGFDDDEDDPQARLISGAIEGVRVMCGYFPNGQTVGSDKYAYKLKWMTRLKELLVRNHSPDEALLVCGDTNVALSDVDVANPGEWADSVLCVEEARDGLRRILNWGLRDLFIEKHPKGGQFSWWDYRQLAFPKNNGLRIDHILATTSMAEKCESIEIDRDERKGSKPSDHAPVVARFAV